MWPSWVLPTPALQSQHSHLLGCWKATSPPFRSSGLLFLPVSHQEFEIELEGSQSLRILCYEKCYDKTKVNKDNNEIVDKIMGKGQIQVRNQGETWSCRPGLYS